MNARRLAASLLLLLFAAPLLAAPPEVTGLSLRGLQLGTTTELVVTGKHLGPEGRVVIRLPDIDITVSGEGSPERLTARIELDADLTPGIWPLYVVTADGISEPILIGVDGLRQGPITAEAGELPVALTGSASGTQVASTTFQGSKGQRVIIEVEAHRLAAKTNPLVRLLDPRGVQLDWSRGVVTAMGDPRVVTVLPADGTYTVEVHDSAFAGQAPNHFRLKIGDYVYADLALPLGVNTRTGGLHLVLTPAATNAPGDAVMRLLASVGTPDGQALPDGIEGLFSGPTPAVKLVTADRPQVSENQGDEPQDAAAPIDIDGEITEPAQKDLYRVTLQGGQKWRFDLYAREAGSPLDGVLTVRAPDGRQLGTSDDADNRLDPRVEIDIPKTIESVLVEVKDMLDRGGPEYAYRLTVTPSNTPSYELSVAEPRIRVPRGGTVLMPVEVKRHHFDGEIRLGFAEGSKLGPVLWTIPAGATRTLIPLTASPGDARTTTWDTLHAEAAPGPGVVLGPTTPITQAQPWLRTTLSLSVVAPRSIDAAWVTDLEDITQGQTLGLTVALRGPVGRKLRLKLLTTQDVPTKKENNKDVPDLARALRLEPETVELPADSVDAQLTLFVPADLPTQVPFDVAVQAELLSEDGKSVVEAAFTEARRVNVEAAQGD